MVHVDLAGRTVRAGVAYFVVRRGKVSTTFVYDPTFITAPDGYDLEPGMTRQAGQRAVDGLPGAFADSAPDRWGRNLIDKRRRAVQRETAQRLPASTDVDYLLGVSDTTRQGNLRFSVGDGPFLSEEHDVPKLVSLPRLLSASDAVTGARQSVSDDDFGAVKALLDAGRRCRGG